MDKLCSHWLLTSCTDHFWRWRGLRRRCARPSGNQAKYEMIRTSNLQNGIASQRVGSSFSRGELVGHQNPEGQVEHFCGGVPAQWWCGTLECPQDRCAHMAQSLKPSLWPLVTGIHQYPRPEAFTMTSSFSCMRSPL